MNLLIVDDEIVTTQVLEEQLDRELLSIDQIYVAYNTSMARDILQKNKVELILCDIEMPKENGIHFLKWVREQKIQTEVIFLTSHEKFEYAYGAVQNGAANYLLKPIDMNKINQALLRVTEKIAWKQKTEEIREYWKIGKKKDGAIFLDKSITGTRCAETGTRGGNKATGDSGRNSGKILCCDSSFCQWQTGLRERKGTGIHL